MLTGSARLSQEAQEQALERARAQGIELQHLELKHKRSALEAQITALRAEFAAQEIESQTIITQRQSQGIQLEKERKSIGLSRKEDVLANKQTRGSK